MHIAEVVNCWMTSWTVHSTVNEIIDLQTKTIPFQSINSLLLTCFFIWLVQSVVFCTVEFHTGFVINQK